MMALRRITTIFACLTCLYIGVPDPVSANTLVADLSLEEVAITTDFNGESLLLFGAVDNAHDDDIIVEFKGPVLKIASRKKDQCRATQHPGNPRPSHPMLLKAFAIF